MKYLHRYVEKEIELALGSSGVVVVTGPKFCGKTTTSRLYSNSSYSLDTKSKIEMVQSNPSSVLVGKTPRLIDEWQNVPDLWNCARSEVDNREEKFGQFIFTGSSTPADKDEIFHSGAGRIVQIEMRPMSLFETTDSKGVVSFSSLFKGERDDSYIINEEYSLRDTAFFLCRGGWPLSLVEDRERSLRITRNYCSTLFNFENSKNRKFRNKKPEIFKMILRSYARNVSTEVRRTKILADINEHEDRKLSEETFDGYLEALNDLYIVKDIDAWNPNFRSRTAIITSPTRHFVDTSIAAFSLNVSPDDLINDPETFGLLFEDFAIKELSIYAQALGGEVRHFRDSNGLECDAVIHLSNGEYCLVEIKLGGETLVEDGCSTLHSLNRKITAEGRKPPAFLMILTAVGDYYVKDDVLVVPINMIKA